jgi:hypothetical protein
MSNARPARSVCEAPQVKIAQAGHYYKAPQWPEPQEAGCELLLTIAG